MATAKNAGSRPRSKSTIHQAVASTRSASGSTPKKRHSSRALSLSIIRLHLASPTGAHPFNHSALGLGTSPALSHRAKPRFPGHQPILGDRNQPLATVRAETAIVVPCFAIAEPPGRWESLCSVCSVGWRASPARQASRRDVATRRSSARWFGSSITRRRPTGTRLGPVQQPAKMAGVDSSSTAGSS